MASGASALQLALTAAGVGPGDDVLVPAFTAVPTASAVVAAGATPVAVDVDPATACLDAGRDRGARRRRRTRAVIVVHLYGFPAELPPPGGELIVIEDAAQAMGALGQPDRSRRGGLLLLSHQEPGGHRRRRGGRHQRRRAGRARSGCCEPTE